MTDESEKVEMAFVMTCAVCGEPMALNAACVFVRTETPSGIEITQRHFACVPSQKDKP